MSEKTVTPWLTGGLVPWFLPYSLWFLQEAWKLELMQLLKIFLQDRTPRCSVMWRQTFQVKSTFYSLRNQVMKIMTTNHISDKCIFLYVNNKSLLQRMWHLSSQQSVTVFSLCSECASSHPGSGQFPLFFHTKKMFARLCMSPPNVHTWQYISNKFVCEGEVHI